MSMQTEKIIIITMLDTLEWAKIVVHIPTKKSSTIYGTTKQGKNISIKL